jgi:hypothetical protein
VDQDFDLLGSEVRHIALGGNPTGDSRRTGCTCWVVGAVGAGSVPGSARHLCVFADS